MRKGSADVKTSLIEKVEKIRKQVKEKYDFTETNLYFLKSISSCALNEKDACKVGLLYMYTWIFIINIYPKTVCSC